MMLDVMILSSLMHSFHPSPSSSSPTRGAPLGTTQEVAAEPERLESDPQGDQADEAGQRLTTATARAPATRVATLTHGGHDDGGGFDDGGDFGGDFGGFDD